MLWAPGPLHISTRSVQQSQATPNDATARPDVLSSSFLSGTMAVASWRSLPPASAPPHHCRGRSFPSISCRRPPLALVPEAACTPGWLDPLFPLPLSHCSCNHHVPWACPLRPPVSLPPCPCTCCFLCLEHSLPLSAPANSS